MYLNVKYLCVGFTLIWPSVSVEILKWGSSHQRAVWHENLMNHKKRLGKDENSDEEFVLWYIRSYLDVLTRDVLHDSRKQLRCIFPFGN